MSKENKIKIMVFVVSFFCVFFLIYPSKIGCYSKECLEFSIALAFLFSWQKVSEYEFLIGNAFYGAYTYGQKIPSLQEDNSDKNKLRRLMWFLSLIFLDIFIIYAIFKISWIFN
ncbi:hypothetical protein [uncultured Gammaproteobacteria bacterium]|jgi:hypothetical protein|nr:hypothetical protein [uncultured Gammaproteobacteria bacterium]CAC9557591.1 hypothetical protein [uncultured Gammaproteobacteria bacterium]CAC9562342.1 hypothetical protein [uncultured Gammaproteobacteria bacterium]CAC9564899.1 hypothetical protein [uncultured Gammaproteobacteria bacterium]CAC9566454.1 hypothetical protein [uncultured Gammaproteobacteria bacterium]